MSKKYYTISSTTAELFNEVHTELTIGSLISRNVECVDIMDHSPTRGEYLLHKYEAEIVDKDDRIHFINLTPARYPEIYNVTEDDLIADINGTDYNRYGENVRNWQKSDYSTTFNKNLTGPYDKARTSNQLIRCGQKSNPWTNGLDERNAIVQDPVQKGAGENVDIIVADNGTWIGHVEFINPNKVNFPNEVVLNPVDYVGGNVLPGDGYCDVLDVVLDGPYYIDPDWFNADPTNRLMTRWDGTIVPQEDEAREWWSDATKRSSSFASAGTVPINQNYTRDNAHGSNSAYPSTGTHGTQCGSQTFGRTHGWAYNANKWQINLFGANNTGGSDGMERGFDVQKIFHQNKPVNPTFGTKDPTISSNSWGFRANKSSSYYYFQSATGIPYSGSLNEPNFMRWMGYDGDRGNWKSEFYDNSTTQAGKELVDSGVIFVVAAGNSGQMQVNPDDPNYDNHISNGSSDGVYSSDGGETFQSFGYTVTGTTNRRGFPQHVGKTEIQTSAGNTTVKFPAINIGALDDDMSSGKERKVNYSDTGNAIDMYMPADGTIAAAVPGAGSTFSYQRYDNTYEGFTHAVESRDIRFSGTSSACPVAAGFLATILQYNRGWTYEDLRGWIQTNIQIQDSTEFYDAARGTTATASEWNDRNRLQGGVARVGYLASHPITTPHPDALNPGPAPTYAVAPVENNVDEGSSLTFNITTTNVADGTTLYWTVTNASDFFTTEGDFTIGSDGTGSVTLTPTADTTTEGPEFFALQIRTSNSSGTIVVTSSAVTINDTSTTPDPNPSPDPIPEPDPDPTPTLSGNTGIASTLVTNEIKTANEVNIFANFDTTSVLDPERNYYNLPQNELPVLNQITASTRLIIIKNTPIDKIAISTTGIDGIGYVDNTFNLDTNYFKNQIIYFTLRVKTVNNYPAKYLNNLSLGDGRDTPDTIFLELVDNGSTLTTTFSSDFGNLSADVHGGYFKGAFKYNGIGDNIKIKARVNSNNIVIRGESNIFNIVPALNGKEFRKINEDNDQRENFINYLYQPNLKNNPKFFTDIIGQIVGDSVDPNTLGVKVYEKISNFLINSNDIDYANIDNLISSLKLIDSNVNKFSEKYPASLKRIVDFFSANKSKIKPIKNYFNQSFDDKGRPSSGLGKNLGPEITMSQTLTGGIYFKPIVAYEKFSQRYYLLNTDPTNSYDFRYLGTNNTFELSSYNTRWGWGLDLPTGVGSFTYMLDDSGNNLILEDNGFRILNEQGGITTSEIPKYYTFYEYIPTIDNSNIFAFYDDTNINSNLDLTTLSGIDNSIDEIILKDIYLGTNLI